MMFLRPLWFVLATLLSLLVSPASASPVIPDFSQRLSVDANASFFEDPSGRMTLDDVLDEVNARRFKDATDGSFNPGISSSTWWVHLTLGPDTKPGSSDDRLLLEVPYAPLDQVDFYQRDASGNLIHFRSGDHLPLEVRPLRHYAPIFPVKLRDGASPDLYLKVKSTGSLRIPLVLWHQQDFLDHVQVQLLVFGLYFGMLALIFLFNLLFFLWLKDVSFLYYIAYVGTMAVFQGAYTGLGYLFVWEDDPVFNANAVVAGIHLLNLFAMMFARRVLKLDGSLPLADNALQWLQWICLFSVPASFILPYSEMVEAGTLMSMVSALTLIASSMVSAWQGQRSARLFLMAWLIFLTSSIVLAAVTLGWLPATPLTVNSLLLGSAMETILLSILLADRVHTTERDRTRSEQKAKIALQAVNRALLESNRVKDEFLATISHEMRTPMNGILQCLGHIRTEKTRERFIEFVDNAEDSAQNLMNLIESVLSYTELQTHEFRIHGEPFRLSRMVGDLREAYSRHAQQKGLDFRIEVDPSIPHVLVGDRRRLSQVLTNLLDNGIKFTAHGFVQLSIKADSIDPTNERVHLSFTVKDSGIGIPAGMENAVFDRFKQLSASRSRQHGGLGIGLAVCKQIAQLMGADLRYRSNIGDGTEFVMTLAMGFKASDTPTPEIFGEEREADVTRTVLVVEDNPVNQLVLKTSLLKLGFNVICASNGAEGVAALEHNPVDLILMDCQMPVMDGYEATRRIRDLPAPKSLVPIVAITANAMSRDRDACIEAGMNDYLSKPANTRVLNETLCKWIPGVKENEDAR